MSDNIIKPIIRFLSRVEWDVVPGAGMVLAFLAWFFGKCIQALFTGREMPTSVATWLLGGGVLLTIGATAYALPVIAAWAERPSKQIVAREPDDPVMREAEAEVERYLGTPL